MIYIKLFAQEKRLWRIEAEVNSGGRDGWGADGEWASKPKSIENRELWNEI